jgi:hypothetical protein
MLPQIVCKDASNTTLAASSVDVDMAAVDPHLGTTPTSFAVFKDVG